MLGGHAQPFQLPRWPGWVRVHIRERLVGCILLCAQDAKTEILVKILDLSIPGSRGWAEFWGNDANVWKGPAGNPDPARDCDHLHGGLAAVSGPLSPDARARQAESEQTDGGFDLTAGPLMKVWAFFRGHGRVPSRLEIARVLRRIGFRHVMLDGARRTIKFDRRGVELDLGGIAKGYTVDRAVQILRSHGISTALVSAGTSSIYALGAPPGGLGWKIKIRDPLDCRKATDVLRLQNYSLSTSGSYEKFFKISGKTYCHIMNPRTGRPVRNMLSAAVLAPSATESDALSTSFFVSGVDGTRRCLAGFSNLAVVLYQPGPSNRHFRRVVLKSHSYGLGRDAIAEISRPADREKPN